MAALQSRGAEMSPKEEEQCEWMFDNQDSMTEEEHAQYIKCTADLIIAEYHLNNLYRLIKERLNKEAG